MSDRHVKLNTGRHGKSVIKQVEQSFQVQITFKFRGRKYYTCYIWGTSFYGAEIWAFWKLDQKYLKTFEMWCWRRMEKTRWKNCVRNEVLHRVQE